MNGNFPFTSYVTYTDHTPTYDVTSTPRPSASYGDLGLGSPHLDNKKVKTILRSQSWPPEHAIRTTLWPELCKRYNHGGGNIYQDVIKGIFKDDDHDDDIDLPVFVETAHMISYHLNSQGKRAVKRLLCAIGSSSPHITFSPVLYALSSLVLHYVDVEEGFGAVYSLLNMEGSFFTQARISYEASPYTLKELARKHCKPSIMLIQRHNQPVENVLENWIWWIFKDLPLQHLVRIVDCMLYEGTKVLYRVGLAILILFHKTVGKAKENLPTNVTSAISQFCENIPFPPEKLLKVAFGIRGLTRKQIKVLQLQHEMYLRSKTNVEHMVSPMSDMQNTTPSRIMLAKLPRSRSFASNPVPVDEFLTSQILDYNQIQMLWKWIPLRMTVCQPELLYTTEEHGTSIRTLYNKVDDQGSTLIVIKTSKNEVLGAYCSGDWSERKHGSGHTTYFGTGETFLFTLAPTPTKYEWVGISQMEDVGTKCSMFQAANGQMLTVGGGNGEGLRLDEDLFQGFTSSCLTFNNPPLVEGGEFKVKAIEAFGFR